MLKTFRESLCAGILITIGGTVFLSCENKTVGAVLFSNIGERAAEMCSAKLAQFPLYTFIRGFFCGILMYLAVSIYKEKNSVLGILFCVPVFILCGFEHSIADMFYLGASGIFSVKIIPFTALVVAGNTFGAIVLPLLKGVHTDEKQG